MTTDFQIKSVYSFDVYPVALLGTGFQNATVLAILDQASANLFADTRALHIQVFPTLPPGTPNDPTAYNWLKLRLVSGEIAYIGLAWIIPESITLVQLQTITVKIGNVNLNDQVRIRQALAANGFNSIEMSVS